jgi:hypothetical protein
LEVRRSALSWCSQGLLADSKESKARRLTYARGEGEMTAPLNAEP